MKLVLLTLFLVLLIGSVGCTTNVGGSKEAREYLETNGFTIVSYENETKEHLTKEKLTRLPNMMYWGLQTQKPESNTNNWIWNLVR